MAKLTHVQRIRFSDADMLLMERLKQLRINPMRFIRSAFREKIERELKDLIKEERKRLNEEKNPF